MGELMGLFQMLYALHAEEINPLYAQDAGFSNSINTMYRSQDNKAIKNRSGQKADTTGRAKARLL